MKYKNINIIVLLIVIFTLMQCKNNGNNNSNITKTSELQQEELPKDFVGFFTKFHSDSVFQLNHISFPLDGFIRSPESDSMIPYKWRKNKWKLHNKFDNYDNIFTRKFYIFDENTVIEKITGIDSLFQMQRRFVKMHNGWNLIHYSVN